MRAEARPAGPRVYVTQALVASILLMFGYQLLMGYGDGSPYVAVHIGANVPWLVSSGQIDRLVTANWLHAGWLHIGVNLIALYSLGRINEQLLGPRRFLVIYLVSCLAGSIASYASMSATFSLGASTGVAGIFGSFGYVLVRYRRELPFLRGALAQWVTMLLVNAAFWFFFRDVPIDHMGHLGGFLGGIATAALTTIGWPPLSSSVLGGRIVGVLAALLTLVVAGGLGVSITRALGPRDDVSVLRVLDRRVTDPASLNLFAWLVAIEPEATRETLETARRTSARSIEALENEVVSGEDATAMWREQRAAFRDTLATIDYRLGDYDSAIARQREALAGQDPAYPTQLARFLRTRVDRDGPLLLPARAPPRLTVALSDRSVLTFDAEGVFSEGLEFFVLVEKDGALVRLVRGRLGAGRALPADHRLPAPLPEGSTVRLALADAETAVPASVAFTVTSHEIIAEVLSYPGPLER